MAAMVDENAGFGAVAEFEHGANNGLLQLQMLAVHEVGNNLAVHTVAQVELAGDLDQAFRATWDDAAT